MASLTVEVPGELHRGLFFVQLPQVRDAMASLTVEVPGAFAGVCFLFSFHRFAMQRHRSLWKSRESFALQALLKIRIACLVSKLPDHAILILSKLNKKQKTKIFG